MNLMNFVCRPVAPLAIALALLGFSLPVSAQEACFVRLDNGVDMTGWQKSATNHHGPGDGWTVEDGAFVGRQTAGQQGGILMTEASYQDVEVVFEVKIDWGCDSGFFFRTTAGDRSYQVNVDFLQDSGVGTIWGESFSQELRVLPYMLTDMGNTAVAAPSETPLFDVSTWSTIWHKDDFSEMRARIEGNPPRIQVWISDVQVMDFTDQQLRGEIEAAGPLAIQVHGGAERWIDGGTVQYKNIRVKDLTVPCDEPDPGVGGAGGEGSAGGGSTSVAGTGGSASGGQPTAGSAGTPSAGASGGMSSAAGSAGTPGSSGGGSAPVTPAASSADSGGCGCRTASNGAAHESWLVLLLGVAALQRRRSGRGSSAKFGCR